MILAALTVTIQLVSIAKSYPGQTSHTLYRRPAAMRISRALLLRQQSGCHFPHIPLRE